MPGPLSETDSLTYWPFSTVLMRISPPVGSTCWALTRRLRTAWRMRLGSACTGGRSLSKSRMRRMWDRSAWGARKSRSSPVRELRLVGSRRRAWPAAKRTKSETTLSMRSVSRRSTSMRFLPFCSRSVMGFSQSSRRSWRFMRRVERGLRISWAMPAAMVPTMLWRSSSARWRSLSSRSARARRSKKMAKPAPAAAPASRVRTGRTVVTGENISGGGGQVEGRGLEELDQLQFVLEALAVDVADLVHDLADQEDAHRVALLAGEALGHLGVVEAAAELEDVQRVDQGGLEADVVDVDREGDLALEALVAGVLDDGADGLVDGEDDQILVPAGDGDLREGFPQQSAHLIEELRVAGFRDRPLDQLRHVYILDAHRHEMFMQKIHKNWVSR